MNSIHDYNDNDLENDFFDMPQDFEEYQEYHEEYLSDVWNYCSLLSVQSILPLIQKLVSLNIVMGIILSCFKLPEASFHMLSGSIGIYLASEVGSSKGRLILTIYFFTSYIVLYCYQYMGKKSKKSGPIIKFAFIASLILSEHFMIEREVFHQIRGMLMVMVMKISSLIDDSLERKKCLGILQYFGYTLCGANILFGPWIPYKEYLELHSKPRKKDIFWVLSICKSLTLSLVCLTVSNCWAAYIIPNKSNRWLLAYRDALSFRYSHYFVSYIAESSMLTAGYSNSKLENKWWSYTIVSPLEVEIPTSLSIVVTKWNGPMHSFLKKSIYQPMKTYGKFASIMVTFLVSSFLHGLEVKVSIVLLSLGIFSYLQVKARSSLSNVFNACVNIKHCKQCTHKYKRNHWGVKILLLLYNFTTIIHLAYLGILMDQSSNNLSIYEKWNDLYFISHIIMIFNLLWII